ncbi:hypothetical protein [Rhizobium leguminosarum]|uniref:hypothetical protein n=1 Tax=Rhizobium leguminosarum TaxID=384 RepID=UPI003F9A9E8B
MAIEGDFFERILKKEAFLELIHQDFYDRSVEMGVEPFWDKGKAQDAYFQWMQDLERIAHVEEKVTKPDHLKCAAHLIYWLRRSSPVNEFAHEAVDLNAPDNERIVFMLKYGREYLAFDLGYRAAQLYETRLGDRQLPPNAFAPRSALGDVPANDFVETMVHVLKLKNVSPHAIFLVLKAIFLRP